MLEELNSIQLLNILKTEKCTKNIFLGIFPRNKLPDKIKYPSCFILNTDPSSERGKHWLAFYFNENKICYFFDSFGNSPKIFGLEKYILKNSKKFTFNKIRYQELFSQSCGYFCLLFLILKCNNISFKKIFSITPFKNEIIFVLIKEN